MKLNRLGNSDLMVSEVCLGTMTWGLQNTETEAHEQLDYAVSRGINFLDTAELYPIPYILPEQIPGTTEKYIGTWLAKHSEMRSKLIIATKVVGRMGPSTKIAAYRSDPPAPGPPYPVARVDRDNIIAACTASLRRLQTDYIDLYQIHWPDRYVPSFGGREYRIDREYESVPIRDTLLGLKELIDTGKIKYYGLSNETTFGICEFVRLADEIGMPRPISVQNPFCLFDRAFEFEMAEACAPRNFNIGLLPWSILAGGVLTGKYLGKLDENKLPTDESIRNSRFGIEAHRKYAYKHRFTTDAALDATEKYLAIAKEANMSLATLAQAFCKTRWYIPSSIIGATTMEQLKENIDAFEVELSEKTLMQIDEVHNSNKDISLTV